MALSMRETAHPSDTALGLTGTMDKPAVRAKREQGSTELSSKALVKPTSLGTSDVLHMSGSLDSEIAALHSNDEESWDRIPDVWKRTCPSVIRTSLLTA